MKYQIYYGKHMLTEIKGVEAAWEAYSLICKLADRFGRVASLVDGETGEVISSSDGWDGDPDLEEDYEPDLEEGFDPYMGCYSDDC